MSNMLPRWWLEPHYDWYCRGGSWELGGSSVRCMTEEFMAAGGKRERQAGPVRWPALGRQHDLPLLVGSKSAVILRSSTCEPSCSVMLVVVPGS